MELHLAPGQPWAGLHDTDFAAVSQRARWPVCWWGGRMEPSFVPQSLKTGQSQGADRNGAIVAAGVTQGRFFA